ncbi:MAG TPA: MMPL family transporter [Jiangellales bacterium]|nr:MMPL family transporter [Jiangellales bacterium]
MNRLLYRIGAASAARPWRTVAAWLAVFVAAIAVSAGFGGQPSDDYDVPGTASQAGTDLLLERFPEMSGADARVVLHDESGAALAPALLADVAERLAGTPSVSVVSPPRLSDDGDTALVAVQYDVPVTEFEGTEGVDALREATAPASEAGLAVAFGGQVPENVMEMDGTAELIGVVVALGVLVLAFGSVVAAGLPLAIAFIGLGIGTAGIGLLAAVYDVSTTAPTVATMVGLGVGIDYALLLVTRHVEGLRQGLPVREAAARATASAGQSVVFAGATVLLSLMGLQFAGLPVYESFGYATGIVVATVVVTSITLVPALCAIAGHRLLGRRGRRAAAPRGTSWTASWAARVGRRPLPWALAAFAVLLAFAAPVLDMRTWPSSAGSQPEESTVRQAYDLTESAFGPGANGPLMVAVDLERTGADALPAIGADLAAHPAVAVVTPPVVSSDGSAAVITVEPTTGPSDDRSADLVDALRADVLPEGTEVTGLTAVFADISDLLAERLWLVLGIVVAASVLLLTVVFRSPVVALKAAIMNLLSIAAAYGVVTAVFQWGWGAEQLGLPHAVPVSSWLPILMFAVLFGLSMDYEVFLLSRIREEWLTSGDSRESVVRGLAATGRVITSAALIMVAVFSGFALDSDVTVKMMGVGMATAVAIDATLVRMVLVPATMALLGRANWWLPGWLDRVLPHVDVHGDAPVELDEPAPVAALGAEPVPVDGAVPVPSPRPATRAGGDDEREMEPVLG